MATKTYTGLTSVIAGNLDDTAIVPVADKNGNSRKSTVAQLRTALMANPLGLIRPGDGTAHEPTYMLPSANVLMADLAVVSANATSHYLGAHVMVKQTVANSGGSAQGIESATWAAHPSGTLGGIYGIVGNLFHTGAGTTTNAYAITGGLVISAGTVTNAYGVRTGGATVAGTGAVTNNYGVWIGGMTGGAVNWSLYITDGGVTFRTSALATNATTGLFFVPSCAGTPTGVPANIPTGQIAMHFDSTNNFLYAYLGGAWKKTTVFA